MRFPLKILHLEDSTNDAELIRAQLEAEWPNCTVVHVKDGIAFERAILSQSFDVILSDYAVPQYSGWGALRFARDKHPEIPFILLSGTLGEEQAVDSLKNGATDYILKQRLSRLVPAIRRAVAEAHERARLQQAENQVRKQAAYLNKARDAIHVRDLDGIIHYWNEAAERIYGWTAAEVLGQHMDTIFPGNTSATAHQHALQQGEWVGELHPTTKDQRDVIVESRWTLVRDSTGVPDSLLIIDTDITERKHLEEQFLRAQRMEIIGALAGGIAHDLNNVLAPICMVSEVLRDDLTSDRSKALMDTVRVSAERGSGLVRQILSFARGVAGEQTILNLKHLAMEVVSLARGTFPRNIGIELSAPESLRSVKGDVTQLHQVLMNLFVNARDAMPKGGALTISLANVDLQAKQTPMRPQPLTGPYVRISVTDTGTGIPSHLLEKIYEPFFTTKAQGKGTGLGLSTVLGIVKTYQGFLEVFSRQDQGTTFHVYLPAHIA